MSRFHDPKRLGSLTEKQFNQAVREAIKPLRTEKEKEAAFEKYRLRWKHLSATHQAPKPEIVPQHKEATPKPVRADIMTWETFEATFKELIPQDQWDLISERFGKMIEEQSYEPVVDPSTLKEGDAIKLELHGKPLDGRFLKALGVDDEGIQSFLVRFERSGQEISVTADMILVPHEAPQPEVVWEEEVLEVVTPPEEQKSESFKLGDRVTAAVAFSDGSTRTISGTVMLTGIHQETLKAAVYSPALPESDQHILLIDQSKLRPSRGEEIARAIIAETGFSPKEVVKVSNRPGERFRVVGHRTTSGVLEVELVPNSLFGYSTTREWLERIEALQNGTEPNNPAELETLRTKVQKIFASSTVWEPVANIERLRKKE